MPKAAQELILPGLLVPRTDLPKEIVFPKKLMFGPGPVNVPQEVIDFMIAHFERGHLDVSFLDAYQECLDMFCEFMMIEPADDKWPLMLPVIMAHPIVLAGLFMPMKIIIGFLMRVKKLCIVLKVKPMALHLLQTMFSSIKSILMNQVTA